MRTMIRENNFYPAFGLSKMQKILEDMNQHLREAPARLADAARKMATLVGTHEKEGDWAITGGLAQGLGGIGAGISAAAETQRKNAEIRQRNAQRDAQASQLNSLANQVGGSRLNLVDIDAALSDWRVSVDEDTKSLFNRLRISAGKISTLGDVDITFSMSDSSCPYRVDGYLKIKKYSKSGRLLGDEIIPIPVWEKGRYQAVLDYRIKTPDNADVTLEFEPYILWKLSTDTQLEHYTRAFRVEDLESGVYRDNFVNYWRGIETAEAKAESERKKKNRVIAFSASACLVLATALAVTFIVTSTRLKNQEKAFAEGSQYIRYSSSDSYSRATEYFSQLPASYDEKIVDVCMQEAREDFPRAELDFELDHVLFLLNTAQSKTASGSELNREISDMKIRTMIRKGDPAVSSVIINAYNREEISYELVAEYAEAIYSSQASGKGSEMADVLVPMLEALLPKDSSFQALIDKYDAVESEYQKAVALFDKKDFESCEAFFAEHQDYKNSSYYLSLCKGVLYWCGTWKDNAGNTFRIEPDQSMDVFYLKGERYSPWELYVRIYDNGEDVTEYLMNHGKHYVIRENNWEHPDGTIIDYRLEGEQNFQTYHFQRSDSSNNSCSILKNDSDIGNAEQVWKRHYHKVSEQ